jgi:hypothetical protein
MNCNSRSIINKLIVTQLIKQFNGIQMFMRLRYWARSRCNPIHTLKTYFSRKYSTKCLTGVSRDSSVGILSRLRAG